MTHFVKTVKVKLKFNREDFDLINDSLSKAEIPWDKFVTGAVLSTFSAAVEEFERSQVKGETDVKSSGNNQEG